MIKAIIVDLDDTLYLEKDYVISGFKEVSKYLSDKYQLNSETIFSILITDFNNGLRNKNFNILIKKLDLDEDIGNLVEIYRNHIPSIKLNKETLEILFILKKDYKLGLITDGHINSQEIKIKKLGLNKIFDEIIINDISKGLTKMNSSCFSDMLNKLNVNPNQTLFISDNSLKDFYMPNKLGIKSLKINIGGQYSHIETIDSQYTTIFNLNEIFNLLRPINVLILPAGSGMAVSAILSLKKDKKIKIFTADSNKLAPGIHLVKDSFILPKFNDKSFLNKIKEIVKKNNIDIIIPALDPILIYFADKKEEFEKLKCKILISNSKTIKMTRDKWVTVNILKDIIPCPKSFIKKENIDINFPLIIKPRDGSGSIGFYKLHNQKDLDFYFEKSDNPIIQEYLPGTEYTVDCFSDESKRLITSIVRERLETKAGISTKGKIVRNNELKKIAKKIAKKIPFFGPFFFQMKKDKNGIPKLLEVNPRISGTMSLSSHSGINIHSLCVRMCMGEKINLPKMKENIYLSRYWEEIYFED